MKTGICTAVGVAGGFIASLFGGWDAALTTLLIFMGVDYVTGLIVAGVFHRSQKSTDGTLESRALTAETLPAVSYTHLTLPTIRLV